MTSGLGGMFPRGLRVGVTAAGPDGPRAVLHARLGELEYVSVLLYDNPGVALASELKPAQAEVAPARRRASRSAGPGNDASSHQRSRGAMQALTLIFPAAVLLVAVLVAAVPWGLPPETKAALPLLPYLGVHYWTERRPAAMPDWLVFLAGFATDVLGQGPLGYWALIYLRRLHARPCRHLRAPARCRAQPRRDGSRRRRDRR